MKINELKEKMHSYAGIVTGPVMLRYTEWMISEALARGIKKIYFLARDGYLLYEIAKRITKSRNIDIECKYFYCSRQSLRMPSYHIIGDELYDLLLLGGYYVTPRSLLKRALFTEDEMKELYRELGIDDEGKQLSDTELDALREKIKSSKFYYERLTERSKSAYPDTVAYMKQEGMFDSDTVAIADSGWTGSMQRSLRQILRNEGYQGKILGFYFGMYTEPKDEADGEYLTYYFSAHKGLRRKMYFSNNLFECMLSAPHAMTMGYKNGGNSVTPILAGELSDKLRALTLAQIDGALEYTDSYLAENGEALTYKKSSKQLYRILKKIMLTPSRDFVTVFGAFTFCDDVTEGYHMTLADGEKRELLGNYMLIPRVFRKLLGRKKEKTEELFWPYGVIAFCPALLRPWYRLNIISWELLKAILRK